MSDVADLRSDTVTRPSAGMRKAMREAELGDDVFGDDPTVNRAAGARRGNVRLRGGAVLSHRHAIQPRRADEPLRPRRRSDPRQEAHTYRYEAGGGAVLGSIQPQPIGTGPTERWIWRGRGGDQARRRALRAHAAAGAGEHDRRQGAAAHYLVKAVRSRGNGEASPSTWTARAFSTPPCAEHEREGPVCRIRFGFVCLSKGLGAPAGTVLVGGRRIHREGAGGRARSSAAPCARPA